MTAGAGASVAETERLALRRLTLDDAEFIRELLNEPAFLRFVGNKRVHTEADARAYLAAGPLASYAGLGFGLYRVELRATGSPIGICGLLKRDALPDVDLGFAFLERFWAKGYASESIAAVLAHARDTCGLGRLCAVTALDNAASMGLLERFGFVEDGRTRLAADGAELRLYRLRLSRRAPGSPSA